MAWVKLDDQAPRKDKMLRAGPAACWLWVCGIAHSQSQLTDGVITFAALPMIGVAGVSRCKKLAETLVSARLFDRITEGYRVHDYLDHNPSRASVLAKRAEDAERKKISERNPSGVRVDSSPTPALPARTGVGWDGKGSEISVSSEGEPGKPMAEVSADDAFARFTAAYPESRRQGGYMAQQAFIAALGAVGLSALLAAVEQHKRSEQWQTAKHIPSMQTWLQDKRWIQVLPERQPEKGRFGTTVEQDVDAVRAQLKREGVL